MKTTHFEFSLKHSILIPYSIDAAYYNHINRLITITDDFYSLIYSKFDLRNLITLSYW